MQMHFVVAAGMIDLDCPPAAGNRPASRSLRAGVTYHQAGQLDRAQSQYQATLQRHPQHPYALNLSGIVAHQSGNSMQAIRLFRSAIEVEPGEAAFHNNCGEACRALRWHELAIASYDRAVAIDPRFRPARYNMGLALQELGRYEAATAQYERLSGLPAAHNNLGVILGELDRDEKATEQFKQALATDPYFAEAHCNLGTCLKRSKRPVDALVHHQTCLRLDPRDWRYRAAFMSCLSDLQVAEAKPALKQDLLATLSFERIGRQDLAFPLATLIRHFAAFKALAVRFENGRAGCSIASLGNTALAAFCEDQLLLAGLSNLVIRDAAIERVLTGLRGGLLEMAVGAERRPDLELALLPFVSALGRQCFLNEYVYSPSATEAGRLETARRLLFLDGAPHRDCRRFLMAVLACYTPLCDLNRDEFFIDLFKSETEDCIKGLIVQQVLEPAEERRLGHGIEVIGPIENTVSQKVRAQYEENPYPRWPGGCGANCESVPRLVRRLFPHIPADSIPAWRSPEILVAGCGTGEQAISRASGIWSAKVLGVDLSLTSLSYAKRKAAELGVANVEFAQADLLNLAVLGRTFDIIECIGVLHHLQDPVAGWTVLTRLLRPGGLMRIGVYSETGRRDIIAAQAYVARKRYEASPDGIRDCRKDLLALRDGSAIANMTKVVDFYTLSETRDLLFHVQEKRFNLPQISKAVRSLGLTFLGFEVDRATRRAYLDRFPDDPNGSSLDNWHGYELENPTTFVGLYLFWLQKTGSPGILG